MAYQYKKRTCDEALELAKSTFRQCVEDHLTKDEINEIRESLEVISGSPKAEEWIEILGFTPHIKDYYEIELYKRSDECPYIEKCYAKILVPRDRNVEDCKFLWKPMVPKYDGPWLS